MEEYNLCPQAMMPHSPTPLPPYHFTFSQFLLDLPSQKLNTSKILKSKVEIFKSLLATKILRLAKHNP